ncbi:MAG: ABC transporter ATP-binding protein [Armatimonadota bacterium]|nr:MAG: ABC transporter ATP-binding protein [Armatimonadota bacterium]
MTSQQPLLRLEGISKVYQMGEVQVVALKEVDLEIAAGHFVCVLGPSGSGKTTLLNLIGGIDTPTSGAITVAGNTLSGMTEDELTLYRRRSVGFIFQFFNLIPTLTALENVELVEELVDEGRGSREALEEVGLTARADHFPSELSGGEQQRVAIARALVKNPQVLLADEPTGNLDMETGRQILAVMRRLNREQGRTVLVVTHNSAIAQIADRALHLRSGEVVESSENPSPLDPELLEW